MVTLVQNNTSNEIIEKLTKEKEDLLEKMNQDSVVPNTGNKSVIDNSNEIIILKSKISDLEKKLSFAEVKVEMQDASLTLVNKDSRRRYHSESLGKYKLFHEINTYFIGIYCFFENTLCPIWIGWILKSF